MLPCSIDGTLFTVGTHDENTDNCSNSINFVMNCFSWNTKAYSLLLLIASLKEQLQVFFFPIWSKHTFKNIERTTKFNSVETEQKHYSVQQHVSLSCLIKKYCIFLFIIPKVALTAITPIIFLVCESLNDHIITSLKPLFFRSTLQFSCHST